MTPDLEQRLAKAIYYASFTEPSDVPQVADALWEKWTDRREHAIRAARAVLQMPEFKNPNP